jgi:hypothetical protein
VSWQSLVTAPLAAGWLRCRTSGLAACLPVALLHGFGYLLGYLLPRLLGFNEKVARTVSIETGTQGGKRLLEPAWHGCMHACTHAWCFDSVVRGRCL